MTSPSSVALKSTSTIRGLTLMPQRHVEAENSVTDPSMWAERHVMIIGAGTGIGQAVAIAFAISGARIALVDSHDTSATQDRVLKAAAAKGIALSDLLILYLHREDSVSLEGSVEEVSRKWGHIDIIINHADHLSSSVGFPTMKEKSIADQQWKCSECGPSNYAIVHAFLPLLLTGSEKTLINMVSSSSSALKPGSGSNMLAEMINQQMTDCLMIDHGHQNLLAYSMHLSESPTKGRLCPASQDHLHESGLDGNTIVFLTAKRREWLAGRHISSSQNVRELLAHKDAIVRDDLLRYKPSLTFGLAPEQVSLPYQRTRGRVPRSSY
ncbi:hypothetical protein ACMFMG_004583 [Clarireedia jacksonii]